MWLLSKFFALSSRYSDIHRKQHRTWCKQGNNSPCPLVSVSRIKKGFYFATRQPTPPFCFWQLPFFGQPNRRISSHLDFHWMLFAKIFAINPFERSLNTLYLSSSSVRKLLLSFLEFGRVEKYAAADVSKMTNQIIIYLT